MDNIYGMHKALKEKNWKYLVRIYWVLDKKWFRDAKYMHRWHLVEV